LKVGGDFVHFDRGFVREPFAGHLHCNASRQSTVVPGEPSIRESVVWNSGEAFSRSVR